MTRARAIAVGVSILMMMAAHVFASDMPPSEIIAKVNATYESMQTYRADGTVVVEISERAKVERSFSILLKKPNLYLISWTQKDTPSWGGTVWSDGSQPYLYMAKEYFKMGSDISALATAAGVSLRSTYITPSLFLPAFKQEPTALSMIQDPKLEKQEQVGGEDCYVLSGVTEGLGKETFWISKSKYLIVKNDFIVDHPAGGLPIVKRTDAQIDEDIQQMGEKPTDENRKKFREMMEAVNNHIKKTPAMKGTFLTTYVNISSPDLRKEDFQFVPPKGTVMKDSMLNAISGEMKWGRK
jgi:outer membrane lipoprotein-sorting protein